MRTEEARAGLRAAIEEALARCQRPRGLPTAVRTIAALRAGGANPADEIDAALLAAVRDLRGELAETRDRHHATMSEVEAIQQELNHEIARLTAPPWRIGRVAGSVSEGGEHRIAVHLGTGLALLSARDAAGPLHVGDCVYVSQDGNVVMGRATSSLLDVGDTAVFDRPLPDGRMVVKHRDEEIVVRAGAALDVTALRAGDSLRWDRSAQLALERIAEPDTGRYLAEVDAAVDTSMVGGHDAILEQLVFALTGALVSPERAARYGYDSQRTVLMHGPAGCGKTLMARVAAAEVERRTGEPCQLFVVKPGEWESPWVGESQANIRRTFERLHAAAGEGAVVLYLDEVEAAGAHRGGGTSRIADKFTSALLVELDGFASRGNVAVISSTNRKDLIDAPLLDRLSDVDIAVPRPDATSARRIFEIHLAPDTPVRPNGASTEATRAGLIDLAVSRLYTPTADGRVATLCMRDGGRRPVQAAELVSGRLIRQICRGACEHAFMRETRGEPGGVTLSDVDRACASAIERLASTLRPANAHFYVEGLSDDASVVRVERPHRRVDRPLEYVDVNPVEPHRVDPTSIDPPPVVS